MEKRTKKKKLPISHRAHALLKKSGPLTTDAVAKRLGVKSRVASHALSGLKRNDRSAFSVRNGENVWRAKGKLPAR